METNDEDIVPRLPAGYCASCGGMTDMVCTDCALNQGVRYIYVCGQSSCHRAHEADAHTPKPQARR
jgi:hypothetical protein